MGKRIFTKWGREIDPEHVLEEYPIRDSEDRVQQGPGRPVAERNEYVGENSHESVFGRVFSECG